MLQSLMDKRVLTLDEDINTVQMHLQIMQRCGWLFDMGQEKKQQQQNIYIYI